ncbi:hypothetical protein EHYA_03778 [Embleya hyalina]|uniref:Uncharacterized protein n=1 Tax=Embleya hyalina TaxID=516124 RepID=A0A401YNA0_9ACTN|nr:hypothetical protein EHYA_03778 [Embleya hyalina]
MAVDALAVARETAHVDVAQHVPHRRAVRCGTCGPIGVAGGGDGDGGFGHVGSSVRAVASRHPTTPAPGPGGLAHRGIDGEHGAERPVLAAGVDHGRRTVLAHDVRGALTARAEAGFGPELRSAVRRPSARLATRIWDRPQDHPHRHDEAGLARARRSPQRGPRPGVTHGSGASGGSRFRLGNLEGSWRSSIGGRRSGSGSRMPRVGDHRSADHRVPPCPRRPVGPLGPVGRAISRDGCTAALGPVRSRDHVGSAA